MSQKAFEFVVCAVMHIYIYYYHYHFDFIIIIIIVITNIVITKSVIVRIKFSLILAYLLFPRLD